MEKFHPEQLAESHLLPSHFTGYTHEIPCLTRSDLFGFWSLPQTQALEEVTKHKRWKESKNYSNYTSCLFAEKLLQLS